MRALVRAVLALAIITVSSATAEKVRSAVPSRPDDRTIVHVLNRLGFGPAPGEIERVRLLGLARYIDQQLHPEAIPDSAMAARLAGFETLGKSTRELARDYFLPALEARRAAQQQAAGNAPAPPADTVTARDMRTPQQMEGMDAERRVLVELTGQKVLRSAYSERQLEEASRWREDRPGTPPRGRRRQEGRRAGPRHPGEPSVNGDLHRHQARAAVRRRQSSRVAGEPRGVHVPRHRRRHSRGRPDHRDVAGILRQRRVSREGENAVRVRRERPSHDGRRRAEPATLRPGAPRAAGISEHQCTWRLTSG